MHPVVAGSLAVLALTAVYSQAADWSILGKSLVVSLSGTIGNFNPRVVVRAAETSTDIPALVGDPVANGGTLRVIMHGEETSDQTFTLSASAWRATTTSAMTRFTYRTYYTRIILERTIAGRARLIVRHKTGFPQYVFPPDPGTAGGIILTLGGGDSYCVSFPAGGRTVRNDGKLWKVVNATSQPGCPSPTPPRCCASGSWCGWTPTSTDCGGTPGAPSDVCDSSGACVPPPATPGGCCESGSSSCLASSDPDFASTCTTLGGTFFPAAVCSPAGTCTP